MKKITRTSEEPKSKIRNTKYDQGKSAQNHKQGETQPITTLQNQVGNAAVQRLLAQRSGDGPTELDDATATRINSARGGGQSLDGGVQTKMGGAMGSDFSGVRIHTGSESNQLNEQLGAKAFTTGNDVFFRDGEYNPSSSSGQELIAHELTHVVQQGSGAVPSSGKMAVNAPGDQFEQEADSVAKQVSSGGVAPGVQRQEVPEEEDPTAAAQMQAEEEEMPAMTKLDIQRQEEEETPAAMAKFDLQRQEEEDLSVQEQAEEEPATEMAQAMEEPEEEVAE